MILRALAVIVLTLIGLSAPAVASASAPAGVDDFSYASWDSRFEVGIDDEGRASMHVTETVAAQFPDFDQNRGIVRGLPMSYEGSSLHLDVLSVTDPSGASVPYETEEDDGVLYILVGDDSYVHGLTTYVIEYEMRDVILEVDTTTGAKPADEFYWDLLPLQSTQPIDAFTAEIVFDAAMTAGLSGDQRCYVGYAGSTRPCDVTRDGSTFRVQQAHLNAGEGVTVAIGFEPGTVLQPSAREDNPLTDSVPPLAALGAVLASTASGISVSVFRRRRRKATGIVIAQYEVPDAMPPLLAAAVITNPEDVIPAEIVHLAVRGGALRIEEGSPSPVLRLLPAGRTFDPLDAAALETLSIDADAEGVITLPEASESFSGRSRALVGSGADAALARGLTTKARSTAAVVWQWIGVAAMVAGIGLSLFGVLSGRESAVPGLVAVVFGAIIVGASSVRGFARHVVLTPDGALADEYLRGVREFIRVAEADRLQMLQSYQGAERRADGSVNVIVLYERLLPYAILFGLEKYWGEVLEFVYAQEQRGATWFGDPGAPFRGAAFSGFRAASGYASTYSAPSSSSSSGGSSGGGFSGGGGGGGFSGGR